MTARGQLLVVGLHATLGLAVLISATVLIATGATITAPLWGLYGTVLGLAGAGAAAIAAVGAAQNGKAQIPQSTLDQLLATQQATLDHLAHARATIDDSTLAGGRRATDPPTPAPAPPPERIAPGL